MAFIVRDPLLPKVRRFSAHSSMIARFDGSTKSGYAVEAAKLPDGQTPTDGFFPGFWPTSFIDDIEVYSPRGWFYYANSFVTDERTKRFMISIGMDWDEFINQDVDKDVDTMWFQFKPGFIWDGSTRPLNNKNYDGPTPPVYEPTTGLLDPTNASITLAHEDAFDLEELDEEGNIEQEATEIAITISYGGGLKRYIEDHELGWEATGAEVTNTGLNSKVIRDKILADPWYYLANSRHLGGKKDSSPFQSYEGGDKTGIPTNTLRPSNRRVGVCTTGLSIKDYIAPITEDRYLNLALFAMMDDGTTWEPFLDFQGDLEIFDQQLSTKSTNGMSQQDKDTDWPTVPIEYDNDGKPIEPNIPTELVTKLLRMDGEVLEYQFTVKFKYKGIKNSLINELLTWYPHFYQDITDIPIEFRGSKDDYQDKQITSMIDTNYKRMLYRLMTVPSETNSLYYFGYLRVDPIRLMKRKDFARLIATKLDQDQDLKNTGGGVVGLIITIIVIVVAVILSVVASPAVAALFLQVMNTVLSGLGLISPAQSALIGYVATVMQVASVIQGGWDQLIQVIQIETFKLVAKELGLSDELIQLASIAYSAYNAGLDSDGNFDVGTLFDGATDMTAPQMLGMTNSVITAVAKYTSEKNAEELQLISLKSEILDKMASEQEYLEREKKSNNAIFTLNKELEVTANPDMINRLLQEFELKNIPTTVVAIEAKSITVM